MITLFSRGDPRKTRDSSQRKGIQEKKFTAGPTVSLPGIKNWQGRDPFFCHPAPEESPDQGIKDPLSDLSNKYHRGICLQSPVTCNITTYSHQGSHVPDHRNSCLSRRKQPGPSPHGWLCILVIMEDRLLFFINTFHEKTRFTLSTLRSPVIVVGSRKTRCEVNNGVNSVLSTGQGKPCAVYGEWALKDTCLEGWMARLLFEAAIAWWDLLQLHVTWLDSPWVMRVRRQRLTLLSPLT